MIQKYLYKIYIPSRIPNMYYFYLDYQSYIDQTVSDRTKDYLEPVTGFKGEIDLEYFIINMG